MALLEADDQAIVAALTKQIRTNSKRYTLLDRYHDGEQRLAQIGIAVPPELRIFTAAVNVPRMAVSEVVSRQNLKGFQRRGSKAGIDEDLQDSWEYNQLTSSSMLVHQDARKYGRGFVSVQTNPDDETEPLIVNEPAEGIGIDISPRGERRAALRLYKDGTDRLATFYQKDSTRWLIKGKNGWEDLDEPDNHKLGRIALVPFLNRPSTGRFQGVSEMADVIAKTDAIARLITNMGVAGETLAWPKRWAAGMEQGDFRDKKGRPVPLFEAYMTAIMTAKNKDAKFGSFATAELENFHNAVNALLAWCAAELGLPLRFMGQEATNPASEGAIKADESRLVKNVEWKNRFDGGAWSDVMSLRDQIRTGEPTTRREIRALWFDPSTPTESQRADAITKLKDAGLLSREGAWDELGWDEPRKDRERAYFAAEEAAANAWAQYPTAGDAAPAADPADDAALV